MEKNNFCNNIAERRAKKKKKKKRVVLSTELVLTTKWARAIIAAKEAEEEAKGQAKAIRVGPLSRTARPLAHTNTKISPILTINYSTKIGNLLAL